MRDWCGSSFDCRLPPPARRRGGFFLTDVIVGFMIVGALSLALVWAVTNTTRARGRLEDSARAARAAEQAMALLRQGQEAPATLDGVELKVRSVGAGQGGQGGERGEGGQAVAGLRWVEVTSAYQGRVASLTGLVPERLAPAAGGSR